MLGWVGGSVSDISMLATSNIVYVKMQPKKPRLLAYKNLYEIIIVVMQYKCKL